MIAILLTLKPLLITLNVIFALGLILLVMLQSGKGGDITSAFGMGNSQSLFGASGTAPILIKLTSFFAVLFVVTSLGLTAVARNETPTTSDLITSEDIKKMEVKQNPVDLSQPEIVAQPTTDGTAQ